MKISNRKIFTRYLRCNRGIAAIEFAICCPLLILLLFGGLEVSYLALMEQKLQKATSALGDLATQGGSVSTGTLDQLAGTMPSMMRPLGFNGTVIFTSAAHFSTPTGPCPAGQPCVAWQYSPTGANNSLFGAVGGVPTLPTDYTVLPNQDVIGVEVFAEYEPILAASSYFIPSFIPRTLYYTAIYKPRQGALTTLN